MKKVTVILGFCVFLIFGCKKETPNMPPTKVQLEFPTQNLLCIDNTINFNWSDATDPENDVLEYRVIIAKDNQLTNIVENRTLSISEITLTLEKGIAFYWQVSAVEKERKQETKSSIFAFYTKAAGIENYAPFTATLKSPENNATVAVGNLDLVWEASDINTSDTLTYELFFGEDENPSLIESALFEKTYNVSVVSKKTYYWKVNVVDDSGAKSIGQVFSFTVE